MEHEDREASRRFGTLLVTHDVEEAVALADRVLVMEAGRFVLELAVDLPRPRRRSDPAFLRRPLAPALRKPSPPPPPRTPVRPPPAFSARRSAAAPEHAFEFEIRGDDGAPAPVSSRTTLPGMMAKPGPSRRKVSLSWRGTL